MDLGGRWAATEADDDLRRSFPRPDFDDSDWRQIEVPGHWRAEPAFATSDGPVLFRRSFEMERLSSGRRAWLVMDGIFYQSDVWLDGSYLGDTEGYFFPHTFDVTSAMADRAEHVVAVEVGCEPSSRRSGRRSLMGVWSDRNCIDPDYNPGGIWAPVGVVTSGPVRISSLRLACAEAGPKRAVVELSALLDSSERVTVALTTEARLTTGGQVAAAVGKQQPLAVGTNRVRWRLEVPGPELWWPIALGEQPLYDIMVSVEAQGEHSDAKVLRTGLRQVRMRDFIWTVNGERVFLKGANLAPTRRDLAYASPAAVAGDVDLARQAGLNLLRVRAHVGRKELYQAADEMGMLVWQDLPLQGGYKGIRRQAVRQAAKAVDLLGHHPSIVVWCGHNEPFASNRAVLDRSIRRALERADPSRPVVPDSGALPVPVRGKGSHLYFGWRRGSGRDLFRAAALWPAVARFVSEFGAQAVPCTEEFMVPELWPDLNWKDLAAHFCLQIGIMDQRVPPERYPSFDRWRDASQDYQAELVRSQVEFLRRLRFRPTGGFAVFCLNDAQPAVSGSLLDYMRRPKAAFKALQAACAPVLVAADWPAPSYRPGDRVAFDVHIVNDRREQLAGAELEATLTWPGGGRRWRLSGEAPGLSVTFVGRVSATLPDLATLQAATRHGVPDGGPCRLVLELRLHWGSRSQLVSNRYESRISEASAYADKGAGPGPSKSAGGARCQAETDK